jgi:ATP-binding cassette subfamily B protein
MSITLKQYWALLVDYLRPQRMRVFVLAALLFSNIGLQLVNPQIMRRFIDTALTGVGAEGLTTMAFLFIGVALAQQILAVAATYLGENVAWTATNWLRYDLARHCLYLDMSFHNDHTPGEMIERIDGDINTLSTFFSQFILRVLGNGLLLVGVLVLLFREHLWVGTSLTLFVAVTLVVINKMRNAAVPYWKLARKASADYFSFLEERLAGTEEIRASGAKAYVMRRFFELLRTFWRTTVKARLMAFAMINIAWVLFAVGTAMAFMVGGSLYQAGALTLGSVYLIVHYTGMLSRPIERISQEIENLQQAGAGVARIQELRQIESRLQANGHRPLRSLDLVQAGQPDLAGPLSASFANISFAYETDDSNGTAPDYVLSDLAFHLEPGRVLGLLGRTGSGKTTMTRLLFRLYDPTSGHVEVGGVDVRDLSLTTLRQRVGMVTQNVQLFHATVRDNLTFFDGTILDGDILQVIYELGLAHWYESLPHGLDTIMAAGGGDLSAGEAQLLAFTRIFLKDPGLVILDEASSRLDPATERLIEGAVDRLLGDRRRTAIIIAHRLATVQRADEIMILEGGRIQEYGLRHVLAHDSNSRFYHLLQTGMEEVLA